MGEKSFGIAVVLASLLWPGGAWAYTRTLMDDGSPIQWSRNGNDQIYYPLSGNAANESGLNPLEVYFSVVRGLQRWQEAAGNSVRFDYWQGVDSQVYQPQSAYDGSSKLFFASRNPGLQGVVSQNVIGVTQVWFDTSSGQIYEADIILNDRDFIFSNTPGDTTGPGAGTITGNRVFIENVITHEFGHAFGLSHSGNMQSTMLYMEAPDQAHLGCDDIHGIRSIYPDDREDQHSTIQGRLQFSNGQAIFGAHVSAISKARGVVAATALSDKNGEYRIEALEAGDYFLYAEPFYDGPATLSDYYSGLQANHCGATAFTRTFQTEGEDDSGKLRRFSTSPGSVVNAGDLTVACASGNSASVQGPFGSTTPFTAMTISDGLAGFGWVDRLSSVFDQRYYRLANLSGNIQIFGMAHSLYSATEIRLELYDSAMNLVSDAVVASPVYSSESAFENRDVHLQVNQLPLGDYYLKVIGEAIPAGRYPGNAGAIDASPFFVLAGSANGDGLGAFLPANGKCRMTENFASYVSPAGGPPRSEEEQPQYGLLGFCGSVDRIGRPPAPPAAIVGWFLPFAALGFFRLRFGSRIATLKI